MRLKATWSLLLLLLVSIQAFAGACDVRCATMATTNSANQMTGMAHCPGVVAQSVSGQVVAALTLSQPCTSHICKSDWSFLQSPVVHELGISSLSLAPLGSAVISLEFASPLQFKADRSTHSIPTYDPLISSLRV